MTLSQPKKGSQEHRTTASVEGKVIKSKGKSFGLNFHLHADTDFSKLVFTYPYLIREHQEGQTLLWKSSELPQFTIAVLFCVISLRIIAPAANCNVAY